MKIRLCDDYFKAEYSSFWALCSHYYCWSEQPPQTFKEFLPRFGALIDLLVEKSVISLHEAASLVPLSSSSSIIVEE